MPYPKIRLADHPSNKDPTSTMILASHTAGDIFRVRGGYLAIIPGPATEIEAILPLFSSIPAAYRALQIVVERSAATLH